MKWEVIDRFGGNAVVAICTEKHFADAIVARFPDGFEIVRQTATETCGSHTELAEQCGDDEAIWGADPNMGDI